MRGAHKLRQFRFPGYQHVTKTYGATKTRKIARQARDETAYVVSEDRSLCSRITPLLYQKIARYTRDENRFYSILRSLATLARKVA